MRLRYDLRTDLALALLPTLTVGVVLFLLEHFGQRHLLFASLASSAFLIYLDPQHPTNSIRTLSIAQVSAAIIGFGTAHFMGPGYLPAMVAMVIAILFMILLNAMHPPAVSTALTFAFNNGEAVPLFLIAVGVLIVLLLLQGASIWLSNRYTKAHPQNRETDVPITRS